MDTVKGTLTDRSSLLEIAIVVVSIAIVGAVSVPRMSHGSDDMSDLTVASGLAVLRNAIDAYCADHGGVFPTAADINIQLTQYTDVSGVVSETKTYPCVYGPYLRHIPVLPAGVRNGCRRIAASDAEDVGWLYTEATGEIAANTATIVPVSNGPSPGGME